VRYHRFLGLLRGFGGGRILLHQRAGRDVLRFDGGSSDDWCQLDGNGLRNTWIIVLLHAQERERTPDVQANHKHSRTGPTDNSRAGPLCEMCSGGHALNDAQERRRPRGRPVATHI